MTQIALVFAITQMLCRNLVMYTEACHLPWPDVASSDIK